MKAIPENIVTSNLEVVVMPNGEVICLGKTVGWFDALGKYLSAKPSIKVTHYGEDYAKIEIGGMEFEVPTALGKALEKELKHD